MDSIIFFNMYIHNAARNRIKHPITSKNEENLIIITQNKTKYNLDMIKK